MVSIEQLQRSFARRHRATRARRRVHNSFDQLLRAVNILPAT